MAGGACGDTPCQRSARMPGGRRIVCQLSAIASEIGNLQPGGAACPTAMSPEIAKQLLDLIDRRGFEPGDKIPTEQELSDALEVSRPVVREALSVLEAMGIFAARQGSGRVLMPFDFGTVLGMLADYVTPKGKWLLDLLAVRQVLESNLLPAAAPTITGATLDEIEEVTKTMERKALRGEYFGAEDRQFHALLYKGINNEVLDGLLEFFWRVYDNLNIDDQAHSQRLDETAAHHRRILDALRAGDIRRAQHHLNTHFYDTGFALTRHTDRISEMRGKSGRALAG